MASRQRQRHSTATPAPSQRSTQAAYEPPQFPLNPTAQRALGSLKDKYVFKLIDKRYEDAQATVTACAGQINDRLKDNNDALTRRKRKATQAEDGDGDNFEELEASLAELKDKVERMTQRMDEGMQKLIDGRHYVQGMKETLAVVADEARLNASTQASTQNARSQPRRRRQAMSSDVVEEEEEEYDEIDPTDPAGATQTVRSTSGAFASKLEDATLRHQNYSKRQRYASDNDYRNFKSIVHNARYPEEEVAMPHESEWFAEPGARTQLGGTAEEDDDDDIQIQRAKTSTKCPLTLQEFKEPLTSSKCKHSFEASAILELLSSSTEREPGRGGQQFVRCPVPSCDARFTKGDLVKDTVLIHRIQRLQRAKRLQEQDAEDGDGGEKGRRGFVIDDDDDDGAADVDAFDSEIKTTQGVKHEAQSTAGSLRMPSTAPPRSSRVVDLGGSSADEDAEEEDEDEDEDEDVEMED